MSVNLIATATTVIDAPPDEVWDALTDPKAIRQYMFGTEVESDWRPGSSIVWKGKWRGQAYEDKGTILNMERERRLKYSHFSPLSGQPDQPEHYHTVTIELSQTDEGDGTQVTLTQDNNASHEEAEHSEKNWRIMLFSLKDLLENQPAHLKKT